MSGTAHTVKLFETAKMPKRIYADLRSANSIVIDGTSCYVVGFIASECKADNNASGQERFEAVDKWFKDNGANDRERVLIHHGDFEQYPDYLFPEGNHE